jgi:endonuclease/exonuclease/phosphatase family metal-dependent hydrolase
MKEKRKKVLKMITGFFCLLIGVILIFGALNVMYYPHYKSSKQEYVHTPSDGEITVMSANVRTWSPTDTAKKSWFYRADLMVKNIADCKPDIIGFQEVTKMHYGYLCDCLKGYDNVLTYRDKSPMSEACPVFYSSERFELIDKGSFWLSETPEKMSKDWGAACYRVCSYVILRDKTSDKELVVFNTHLDHISDEARINGIKVVLDKIEQFGSKPCVIMGDFNAEEDSETYKAATSMFRDAKYETAEPEHGATYQGFGKALDRENIDYFMISKTGITVNDYRIIRTTFDGAYPSDHFPILLKITVD